MCEEGERELQPWVEEQIKEVDDSNPPHLLQIWNNQIQHTVNQIQSGKSWIRPYYMFVLLLVLAFSKILFEKKVPDWEAHVVEQCTYLIERPSSWNGVRTWLRGTRDGTVYVPDWEAPVTAENRNSETGLISVTARFKPSPREGACERTTEGASKAYWFIEIGCL